MLVTEYRLLRQLADLPPQLGSKLKLVIRNRRRRNHRNKSAFDLFSLWESTTRIAIPQIHLRAPTSRATQAPTSPHHPTIITTGMSTKATPTDLSALQRKIWAGSLPLEIKLAASECRTYDQSEPYLVRPISPPSARHLRPSLQPQNSSRELPQPPQSRLKMRD